MSAQRRQQLADVLRDFRDGLLDDVDQGVDRILEIMWLTPDLPRANLGHSIKVLPDRDSGASD